MGQAEVEQVAGTWPLLRKWLFKREPAPNIVHITAFFAGIGGCCTLALAYHRYRMDKQKEALEIERWNAENTVNTLVDEISRTRPRNLLTDIRLYRKALAREIAGPLREHTADDLQSKVSDVWMKRREAGDDPDAKRMEFHRLDISLMWANMARLWRLHDEDEETRGQLKEVMFDELIVGRGVAMNTLRYVEPLDKAICREQKLSWDEHKPRMYAFIRRTYNIPDDWPPEDLDDLKPPIYVSDIAKV